jgi:hypothetical protein
MMIRDLLSKSIGYSLAAALALSAAVAHATMYRWVDENGSVNYSDQPPANPATVRQLTVIDEPRITKYEKRSVEIIENEKQRLGDTPGQAQDRATGTSPGYDTASVPLYNPQFDNSPGASQLPRSGLRSLQPEAVRDPCLRSSDPRCPEKNRAAYVPYLGYAPSAAGMAHGSSPAAVGSSSAVGATGAVGGTIAGTPLAPTRRTPDWRQSLKNAKDLQ